MLIWVLKSIKLEVLLQKLGLKPFEFGMEVMMVYQDASVFNAAVLDIKEEVATCAVASTPQKGNHTIAFKMPSIQS
eukprot:755317-Amphidinium_carterae.1